jgi:hypothetical protein
MIVACRKLHQESTVCLCFQGILGRQFEASGQQACITWMTLWLSFLKMRAFLLFHSCQQQRPKKVLYWVAGNAWILGIECIDLMERSSEICRPISVQKDLANGQCSHFNEMTTSFTNLAVSNLFLNRFTRH